MISMKLDENYDICLNELGNIATVIDNESVKQNVITALKLIQGEYIYNIYLGMPWFFFLGDTNFDDEIFKEYINEIVLNVYGVSQVLESSYIYDREKRIYNYTLTIQLTNGEIENVTTTQ